MASAHSCQVRDFYWINTQKTRYIPNMSASNIIQAHTYYVLQTLLATNDTKINAREKIA